MHIHNTICWFAQGANDGSLDTRHCSTNSCIDAATLLVSGAAAILLLRRWLAQQLL
jgi:hypothetical protein